MITSQQRAEHNPAIKARFRLAPQAGDIVTVTPNNGYKRLATRIVGLPPAKADWLSDQSTAPEITGSQSWTVTVMGCRAPYQAGTGRRLTPPIPITGTSDQPS